MNVFTLPDGFPGREETFETLARGPGVRVERILSAGHTTAPGTWYDQDDDEWVALLQGRARLRFEDGAVVEMAPGDALILAAHRRHRVEWTQTDPPCVWLAVHAPLSDPSP